MKLAFCGKSTMKYSVNLKKLACFYLVAVIAVFNFLQHPTAACASANLTSSTAVLEQTVAPQNCCCDSFDCCARRKTDCSGNPMDKTLPVSLKLPALRLMPVLSPGILAGIGERPSCNSSQPLRLILGCSSIKPAKLYLVNRTLLI
jgi:hypothetical protein